MGYMALFFSLFWGVYGLSQRREWRRGLAKAWTVNEYSGLRPQLICLSSSDESLQLIVGLVIRFSLRKLLSPLSYMCTAYLKRQAFDYTVY